MRFNVHCERSVRYAAQFEIEASNEAEAMVKGQCLLDGSSPHAELLDWQAESVERQEVESVEEINPTTLPS